MTQPVTDQERLALEAGAAVLLVSTDLEEIAGICHRALVFNRGRVAAELEGSILNVAELVHAAAGEAPDSHKLDGQPNQNSSQVQVRG